MRRGYSTPRKPRDNDRSIEDANMNKAAQFWSVSFFVLFAFFQFIDWVEQVGIPLPILILTGIGLAALSNYDKRQSFPLFSSVFDPIPMVVKKGESVPINAPVNPGKSLDE